jgi:hypothetical protein
MSGRLTLFLSVLLFASGVFADEGDYLMGLSAYKDGLNSMARMSLEAYLEGESEESKKVYSQYLLYRILMDEKNFDDAYGYFEKIENVKDDRFDKQAMSSDKMRFLVKKDCEAAAKHLIKEKGAVTAAVYVDSKCPMSDETAQAVAASGADDAVMVNAALKIKDSYKAAELLFSKVNPKKLSDDQAHYFGVYFYKNENYDNFWKLYSVHKDSDMVNLALDRLWSLKEYDKYTASLEHNSRYALDRASYCRAIESYKQQKKSFDCSLVDKCMEERGADYAKIKIACLLKSGETEAVSEFLDSLDAAAVSGVCEYIPYIIDKKVYKGDSYSKFASCGNRFDIAELLYRQKKFASLRDIAVKGSDDRDYYYATLAYVGLGNLKKAGEAASKVKDAELNAYLKGQIK